jgi:exopolysaccharide biosynthesis polyprenyl glycosylphosphotransferase
MIKTSSTELSGLSPAIATYPHRGREVVPAPSRLLLQRLAPQAMRRHFVRGVARVAVLLAADGAAFFAVRAIVRAIRDHAVLGPGLASWASAAIPRGYLGGWQFVAALLVALFLTGAYGRGDARRDVGQLFKAVALAVALSLWESLWQHPTARVLLQVAVTLPAMWGALALERTLVDRAIFSAVRWLRGGAERVVFVGDRTDANAQRVHDQLLAGHELTAEHWVNLRTTTDVETEDDLGHVMDRLWGALETTRADTVVISGEVPPRMFEAIVEAATSGGVRVLAAPRVDSVERRRPGLVWYSDSPFVELTIPALKAWQLMVKRVMDVTLAGVGVVLLAPVFAAIAAAIKFGSPGPVFFSQERVGYAGKVFRVLKFRTMRVGADAEKAQLAHLNHTGDPRLFKIPNDPRITRVGYFLRKWSLDELPQLWNVLMGDMSLVGPRPFFESDLKEYLDHHFARLGAKPGITGLWQVKGRSAVTDFEEVVRLDREYIDRWSLWMDLHILFQTFPAVLRNTGAY